MADPADDQILLSPHPLDIQAALAFVASPAAGAVDLFLGTTRAETHPEHGPLVALDYSAYEEMALPFLRQLVAAARTRWPLCRVALHHRTGRVAIGEPSVIIAVSAPHRAAAFEACRHLIEELKASAPIWKQDLYDHHTHWHNDPGDSS